MMFKVSFMKTMWVIAMLGALCLPACEENVVDSFPVPSGGGITFDGVSLWVSDGDKVIYQMDTEGVIIDFLEIEVEAQSITIDGDFFWVIDFEGDYIHKLDRNGALVESIEVPVVCSPTDIALSADSFWITDCFAEKIYRLDKSGNHVDTLDAPGLSPGGIVFDGTWLWVAAAEPIVEGKEERFGKIFKLDLSGMVVDWIYAPGGEWTFGIADGGDCLWFSANTKKGSSESTIFKILKP